MVILLFTISFKNHKNLFLWNNSLSASFIALLLRSCRPSDITRLVISITVDSVYSVVLRWYWPNVKNERDERLIPIVTDSYPSTSIIFVACCGWCPASCFHALPNPIFLSSYPAVFEGKIINARTAEFFSYISHVLKFSDSKIAKRLGAVKCVQSFLW